MYTEKRVNHFNYTQKIIAAVLSLIILMSTVTISNFFTTEIKAAEILTDGDYSYTILADGTAEITGYLGSDINITIPGVFNDINISSIGSRAFEDKDTIESVTFLEGIKNVKDHAFCKCNSLKTINFSSTVTSVGSGCFEDCKGLQSVEFPSTVKSIGEFAFNGCSILENVILHDGLEKMGYHFLSGTTVSEIYIPKTVTDAREAFAGDEFLESVTFAEGITSIPNDMFEGASLISELIIPDTVTKIGNDSLCRMNSLERIVIPDSVTELGNYVLYECKNLKDVTIGKSVTKIPDNAFAGCTGLKEISVPANVTAIGDYAFSTCSKLESVELNEGLTDIGRNAFEKTALKEIALPSTLVKGVSPFYNCSSLKSIIFPENTSFLLEGLCCGTGIESISIPEGITVIPKNTFRDCKMLKQVTLPTTVKSIEREAFYNCISLESIDIPEKVEKIGAFAFGYTTSLEECTFHEGIQTLEGELFTGSAVTSIYIPKTLSSTSSPFSKSNISNVTFSDGIKNLTNDLFYEAYGLKEITIPETVVKIGEFCFSKTNIESAVIPDSVKYMGREVFAKCENLYAVKIGKGLRTVPEGCFRDCKLLQNVYIPQNVTDMGDASFANSGIYYQILPDGIKNIPNYTFSECDNLTGVTCADDLESIGFYAFGKCTHFTTLKSSAQAPSFENSSFEECPNFTDPRFYVFNRANTGIESTGNIGIDNTLVHFTLKYDIRDDWKDEDTVMKKLYLNIPDNFELITASISTEGFGFDDSTYTGDYKSFDLTDGMTSGKMRFSGYISGNTDVLNSISAEVEFYYKGIYFRKPLGNVEITTSRLSVFAPSVTTDGRINVSGYSAFGDKKVTVNIARISSDGTREEEISYSADPNKYTGKYISGDISILPEGKTPAYNDEFEVYTECSGTKSDTVKFIYKPDAVTVKKAYESVNIRKFTGPNENEGSTTYDITNIFNAGASPVITINPALMMQFKIQLENDENISEAVLMSHKGDEWKFMNLYYDAKSDMWIGEGYFDITEHEITDGQNYVPGALNIIYFYGEREDRYRSHFYGSSSSLASTGDELIADYDEEEIFYYDKDGKPHGKIGDPNETIKGAIRDMFIGAITGDWKEVPSAFVVGGLKSLWEWGNTNHNVEKLFMGGHGFIGPDGLPVLPGDPGYEEKIGDMVNKDCEKDGKQRNLIDPAGIVYEAVKGNTVEGATATIYKLNTDTDEWEVWNASDYEQENPLKTNNEGAYAWLTDEGRFRVEISKEGYETQISEEFDVPPEKLDLDFSLVDKTTSPSAAITKNEETGAYTLKFSKFMKVDTVNEESIVITGLDDVSISPVYLNEGDEYADTFVINGNAKDTDIIFNLNGTAQSYSGVTSQIETFSFVEYPDGDVNMDKILDIRDATEIQKYLSLLSEFTPVQQKLADFNGDNSVNITDVTEIQKALAKID